jgi:hypothetical protein
MPPEPIRRAAYDIGPAVKEQLIRDLSQARSRAYATPRRNYYAGAVPGPEQAFDGELFSQALGHIIEKADPQLAKLVRELGAEHIEALHISNAPLEHKPHEENAIAYHFARGLAAIANEKHASLDMGRENGKKGLPWHRDPTRCPPHPLADITFLACLRGDPNVKTQFARYDPCIDDKDRYTQAKERFAGLFSVALGAGEMMLFNNKALMHSRLDNSNNVKERRILVGMTYGGAAREYDPENPADREWITTAAGLLTKPKHAQLARGRA